MKKIALLLCLTLILSSCTDSHNSSPDNITEIQTSTTHEVVTTIAESTAKVETNDDAPEITKTTTTKSAVTSATEKKADEVNKNKSYTSLSDVPLGLMVSNRIEFESLHNSLTYWKSYLDRGLDRVADYNTRENQLSLDTEYYPVLGRKTSGIITTNEAYLNSEIEKYQFSPINTNYDQITANPVTLTISEVDEKRTLVKSADFSYHIAYSSCVTKYAFIKKIDDEHYDFIIDPAYMYDLPLLSGDTSLMKFNVNGEDFYADTLFVNGYIPYYAENFETTVGEDYVYALITFKYFDVSHNTADGYHNSADIIKIEPVTEDTSSVISGEYHKKLISENEEMSDIYNAVSAAKDIITSENVIGVNAVDLDFDGTVEIIVQKADNHTDGPGPEGPAEFYDIVNGEPVFLGSYYILIDYKTKLYSCEYGGKKGVLINGLEYETEEFRSYGWHFLTITDGKLNIELVTGDKYADNKGNEYYYLGELIEIDEIETENIFGGTSKSYTYGNYIGYGYEGLFNIENRLNQTVPTKLNAKEYTELGFLKHYYVYYSDINGQCLKDEDVERLAVQLALKAVHIPLEAKYKSHFYQTLDFAKAKPVIYLYPKEETDVTVKVNFRDGSEFTCTYPQYSDGWNVKAMPNGTLYDENGNEYYCLYWEGSGGEPLDTSRGFCVKGEETAAFLREKLMNIGLSARETNEFIIYWLPKMEDNPYNIITFHTEEYIKDVPLSVTPTPDSMIRVFMTFTPTGSFRDIPEQILPSYERKGFTLVEWGGAEY